MDFEWRRTDGLCVTSDSKWHTADKIPSVQRYISYSSKELSTALKVKVQLLLFILNGDVTVHVTYLVIAESTLFLFLNCRPY